jgi:integrase
MKFHFTDSAIKRFKLPPGKTQIDLFETAGDNKSLGMTVGKQKRSWLVMWYREGRTQRKNIGEWPAMNTSSAWKTLHAFSTERAETAKLAGSFAEVAGEWFKQDVEKRGLRSAREVRRHLDFYVMNRWGKRPFVEIRRKQVADLLDDIADNNGLAQADAVYGTLNKLFRWFEGRDENYRSPMHARLKRGAVKKRDRHLSEDEIRALWKACDKSNVTFGALVKTLLLTGQRREKVVTMKWEDLSADCDVWRIATESREKGNAGEITLPPVLAALLRSRPRIVGNPYVFAGRGAGPFNSFSQRKEELDPLLPADMPAWTLHDLRRTARGLMSKLGIPTETAERVLGHAIAGVQGVYDNPAAYRARVDQALVQLATEVERIVSDEPEGKVIALRRG